MDQLDVEGLEKHCSHTQQDAASCSAKEKRENFLNLLTLGCRQSLVDVLKFCAGNEARDALVVARSPERGKPEGGGGMQKI